MLRKSRYLYWTRLMSKVAVPRLKIFQPSGRNAYVTLAPMVVFSDAAQILVAPGEILQSA